MYTLLMQIALLLVDPTPPNPVSHALSQSPHTQRNHTAFVPSAKTQPQTQTIKPTEAKTTTTLTQCWQFNDALRKQKKKLSSTVSSSLHLSIKPAI